MQKSCCPGQCGETCDYYAHLNLDPKTLNDWTPENKTCGQLVEAFVGSAKCSKANGFRFTA